jgi:ABC transport system ATP-binding/permease protein
MHVPLTKYLDALNSFYKKQYNRASDAKDKLTEALIARNGADKVTALKSGFTNEYLNDVVLNRNSTDLFVNYENKLVRRFQPVYMEGPANSIRAPYYVNSKSLFGKYFNTYGINLLVIFAMTGLLAITLYFNLLRKMFNMLSGIAKR